MKYCNLFSYLEEQQVNCLRIAKASNDGTQAQEEWLRIAEVLMKRRAEHLAACRKCGASR